MEFLDGRTLKDVVQQEAPLDPTRAIDLTVQVLRAARFAHRRGIIHRDLKPHNVIVDEEGRAKVTDFGIARAGASDMTQTGSIMGTAQYLSPEQAQGHAVSEPSDLYSIGIILYELLTGRVPFEGESAVTIALKHVNERPIAAEHAQPRGAARARGASCCARWRRTRRAASPTPTRSSRRSSTPARCSTARVRSAPPTVAEERATYEPRIRRRLADEVYEEPPGRRWWLWLVGFLLIAAHRLRRLPAPRQNAARAGRGARRRRQRRRRPRPPR